MMKNSLILAGIAALFANFASADGQRAFKKCASCHSINEGGKNKNGPNLWNIMNRGIAKSEGFKYSKKFSQWSESFPEGWDEVLMDLWLTDSKKLVKGTKMRVKVKKEKDRLAIIEYLKENGVQPE